MAYINNNFCVKRRTDLEDQETEVLCLDVLLNQNVP